MTQVAAVALAAGKSSRMGCDKLSLSFGEHTILEQVLENVGRSNITTKYVVIPPQREELRLSAEQAACTVVENARFESGQASSLQCGLEAVGDVEGVMVFLGDQPLVTPACINLLVDVFCKNPLHWVAPVRKGVRGNPVIIPATWFHKVMELSGDTGARPLFQDSTLPLLLVETEEDGPFVDVDTKEDYMRVVERAAPLTERLS